MIKFIRKKTIKNRIINVIRKTFLVGALTMYSATALAAVANDALPTNGKFMAGTGNIMSANGVMNVNQTTQNAAVKWGSFNVGANATVNFNFNNKQDGAYNILNFSHNNGAASEIYGRLKAGANANVWLVNPNGVIIGKGAQIDVGNMHLSAKELTDHQLETVATQNIGAVVSAGANTAAELMSMGNMYTNTISFDGNRVVIDADKLYKYDGTKADFMDESKTRSLTEAENKVTIGTSGGYLSINNAKEVVVGYTVYDPDFIKTPAEGTPGSDNYKPAVKGSYEGSNKWRDLYATVNGVADTRVGFAWVEDSTQLERIGEGTNTLSRDFALKDGIAAINTKEMNDGAGFKPIGTDASHAFTGKFDGLNYDIYGLTINRPDENNIGMFGYAADNAVIRNVNLVSGSIVGNNNVGGVVGNADGTKITVENAKNSARVLGVENVGGIAGLANNTNFINVENVALIRGNVNVGGIVGNMTNSTITGETYNTGAVKGIVNYKETLGLDVIDSSDSDEVKAEKIANNIQKTNGANERVYDIIPNALSQTLTNSGAPEIGDLFTFKTHNGVKLENFTCTITGFSGEIIDGEMAIGATITGTVTSAFYNSVDQNGRVGQSVTLRRDNTNSYTIIWTDGNWGGKPNDELKYQRQELFTESQSHDIGGIAGTATNSIIGNESGFTIYNDVEIKGGYNIGGIVGSLNTNNGGETLIQNVRNNGEITALGYKNDAYYYYTHAANSGNNVSVFNSALYANRLTDEDWVSKANGSNRNNRRVAKKTVTTANAGGIIGIASGTGSNKVSIKDVENTANVASALQDNGTADKADDYYLAGNVGGIVGAAVGGTIDQNTGEVSSSGSGIIIENATNVENKVAGAHNVGGIAGYGVNVTIKNSLNDGGDISATGARNKNDQTIISGSLNDYGYSREAVRGTTIQSGQYVDYVTGNIGGVLGYMYGDSSYLDNVRNRGYVHTQELAADGVLRDNNQAANVGGIVGKVVRSSTLDWNGNTTDVNAANYKEGLIGTAAIKNAANTGVVSGYTGIGGVAGFMYNGEIEKSYNLGNVRAALAQSAFNDQANMAGILGDTPAATTARVKIYDVYNAGDLGDDTYETYGRHFGGIVGRLNGEINKAYNAGDIYNGSDNVGGIVGYFQNGAGASGQNYLTNVFNTGNINVVYQDGRQNSLSNVGGIVGVGDSGKITNAYNLGAIRSFGTDRLTGQNNQYTLNSIGGITGKGMTLENVYSTGELYIGLLHYKNDGTYDENIVADERSDSNVFKLNNNNNITKGYFIKPENQTLFATAEGESNVIDIDYNDRYDVSKYGFVSDYTSSNPTQAITGGWRMYLYDERTGLVITPIKDADGHVTGYSDSNDQELTSEEYKYIRATLPTLNAFMPNISNYLGGNKVAEDTNGSMHYDTQKVKDELGVKYVQYGNEYNPLLTFVNMNVDGNNLDIDYQKAKFGGSTITGRGGLVVENGGLNINHIDSSEYFSGTYMAGNGDLTISATKCTLNIASDAKMYGASVTVINQDHDVNINGSIESYDGDIKIEGENIELYGGITSSSIYTDDSTKASKKYKEGDQTTISGVSKSSFGKNLDYTNVGNYAKDVDNKIETFNKTVTTTRNGNITISADLNNDGVITSGGNVGLYLGNNRTGKVSTDGNLTIIGKDIYSDADMKIGVNETNTLTFKGEDIVFDLSNIGITAPIKKTDGTEYSDDEKRRITLNQLVTDFSGTGGSNIAFESLNGTKTDAMMVLDYFEANDELNLNKYGTNAAGMNTTLNGATVASKDLVYTWISNAKQLKNIQQAYTDATSSADKTAILATNFALKNDIDASEVEDFVTIGLNVNDDGSYSYTEYTGTFDGRGKNLNALSPHDDTVGNTGLFGTIDTSGAVKDLNINASRLSSKASRVGLVAGTNNGTITNIKTFGNTIKDTNEALKTPAFIGGLVGLNGLTGTINGASRTEDIVYSESENVQTDVGGVAGMNLGVIYNTTGKSDVSVSDGGATSLGGVAGVNAGILMDVNSLGVTAGLYEHANGTFTGAENAGGIAGENRTVYATKNGIKNTSAVSYNVKDKDGNIIVNFTRGGIITEAYNDSKVKGWSNTGGVVGKNFGAGDELAHTWDNPATEAIEQEIVTNTLAGDVYYAANAADVIGGQNVGGLAGVNNGAMKGEVSQTVTEYKTQTISLPKVHPNGTPVLDTSNNPVIENYNVSVGYIYENGSLVKVVVPEKAVIDNNGNISFVNQILDNTIDNWSTYTGNATPATEVNSFNTDYVFDQIIFGRNSGKITAKSGLEDFKDNTLISNGTNVGGLIGISGPAADVDHLLNGKAASVYGKVNVGGLIGLNQGILQNSVNLMQNNDISGAINVGGIVGENSGIIAKIENTNKFNITVNKDYVNLEDGSLKENIVYKQFVGDKETENIVHTYEQGTDHASYFGGILGHNVAKGNGTVAGHENDGGIVADVINTANVTIEHPANYVGGIMGSNDGTIAGENFALYGDITAEGYLRNKGEVGVKNDSHKGDYVGGVIGQNNSNISKTDITNDIEGTVYGINYVGGIIGQNTASVAGGRDSADNYYKYDVYNNGSVSGTNHVGGLIGENAVNGSITLAYNTGAVKGTKDVGGIVGTNAGVVDQVFNATSPYGVDGKAWGEADSVTVGFVAGVTGTTNVGGLVGSNGGTISNAYNDGKVIGDNNVGAVVGANYILPEDKDVVLTTSNVKLGILNTSWANVVYDGTANATKPLVGSNSVTFADENTESGTTTVSGTLANNYSVSFIEATVDGITKISIADMVKEKTFGTEQGKGLHNGYWTFYDNASTPLLKNFLTKAYFVPTGDYANAFTYNAKEQGGVVRVVDGHVLVYKVVDGQETSTVLGEIFAADASGDHSLADYLQTRDANADGTIAGLNDGKQLIIGKKDGVNANSYSLLYSNQINTYYNQNVVNKDGNVERVVNPNMLGYEFFKADLTEATKATYDPTKPIYDPSRPDYIPNPEFDPEKPVGPTNPESILNPDRNPDGVTPETPHVPTGNEFLVPADPVAPTYDIKKAVIEGNANDVTRTYGNIALNANGNSETDYKITIDQSVIADTDKAKLKKLYGVNTDEALLEKLFNIVKPSVDDSTTYVNDGALTGNTEGAVTKDVTTDGYNWTGTVNLKEAYLEGLTDANKEKVKEILYNYALNSSDDYTKAYEKVKMGKGTATGKSEITRADITIKINDHADIVYGTDNPQNWTSQIKVENGEFNTEAHDQSTTNIKNGDNLSDILSYTYGTAAYLSSGNTNNVGSYEVNQGTVTGAGKFGNYNITYETGNVNITPATLEIEATEVHRTYGDATLTDSTAYGFTVSGWKYGEGIDENLAKISLNAGSEVDQALHGPNTEGKVTQDVWDGYTWNGNVTETLQNYVIKEKDNTTAAVVDGTVNITGKSIVKPKSINVVLNSFDIVYGATLEDNGNLVADEHHLYLTKGEKVYTDNVESLYTISDSGLVNGDLHGSDIITIDGFIKKSSSGDVTDNEFAGFISDTYGGHAKTDNVGTYQWTVQGNTAGISVADNIHGMKNYVVNSVAEGSVNVKHAILSATGGGDVYRYYGESKMYELVETAGQKTLQELTSYKTISGAVTGTAYGEDTSDVTITTSGAEDYAVKDCTDPKKTNDVGAYTWGGGTVTVINNAMDENGSLQNYRFWNENIGTDGKVIGASISTTNSLGGASYVLPQVVNVKLNNQEIVYGTDMDKAQADYIKLGVVSTATGAITATRDNVIDTDGNTLKANGDTINLRNAINDIDATDIVYVEKGTDGKDSAYIGHMTNNVKLDTDGNPLPYVDTIDIKYGETGTKLYAHEVDFDPFATGKYASIDDKGNYKIVFEMGDTTITQRELTVGGLSGQIVYGSDTTDSSNITDITNAVVTGGAGDNLGVYGESLGFTQGSIVDIIADDNSGNFRDVANGRNTADVGTYNNSINRVVDITNKNYKLVSTDTNNPLTVVDGKNYIAGTLTVTPADITVALNNFTVLYGDQRTGYTISSDYTRPGTTIADAEQTFIYNNADLRNGDDISKVIGWSDASQITNNAFGDDTYTVGVSSNNALKADAATNLTGVTRAADDSKITGVSAGNGNYNVTLLDGSVDVIARQVVIVDPDKEIPTGSDPFDPTKDDPTIKFNPDAVYFKADAVERTYGDTTITNNSGKYQVTVSGLVEKDKTGVNTFEGGTIVKDSALITYKDGEETKIGTANANGDYSWNAKVGDVWNVVAKSGTSGNYVLASGDTIASATDTDVIGDSRVNRAKLTIQLSDKLGIVYGTDESTITYDDATIITGSENTTYTTANGLADQDSSKTYKDLFAFDDQNTGYKEGKGLDVTNGTDKYQYYHNAINAVGGQHVVGGNTTNQFVISGDTTGTLLTGHISNTNAVVQKTKATGVSYDGNYDVTILSGNVDFNKKTLTTTTDPSDPNSPNVKAEDVTRVYGNLTPNTYTATIQSGLVSWDSNKDKTVTVTDIADGAIVAGTPSEPSKTNNVGEYKWTGTVTLSDDLKNNYDVGPVEAKSTVTPATINIKVNNVTSVYGSAESTVKVTSSESDTKVVIPTDSINGDTIESILGGSNAVTLHNGGYINSTTTKDAGTYEHTVSGITNLVPGSLTYDANGKGTGKLLFNGFENFIVEVESGKSTIEKADLVIQMGGKEGIVYGTNENWITYDAPTTIASATKNGTTYTSTHGGLAKQDTDANLTLADIVNITGKNAGYEENGKGKDVKDASGNTINYAYNGMGGSNVEGGTTTAVENGTLVGETIFTGGQTTNYNVTIVSGTVNFQPRPVEAVDPNRPPVDPSKPGYDPDPTKPMVPVNPDDPHTPYIPNPNYDPFNPGVQPQDPNVPPTIPNPNYDENKPEDPVENPKTIPDPSYDPTNPEDPRNKVYVMGNTVERYEGDTTIVDSKRENGSSDGKKNYGIDKIAGLPSWVPAPSVEVTDPVAQDGGVTGPNSTNPVGTYDWTGSLTGLDNNFVSPASVPGKSVVLPVPNVPMEANPVEDIYPWLHRTNGDHGWGHQEHWRERKAEVKFTLGGADFFNDLASLEYDDYDADSLNAKS